MITVERDGWSAVRTRTFARDGGCIATNREVFGDDVAVDACADRFGARFPTWTYVTANDVEFDHVKEEVGMTLRGADDEAHGVSVCAWHHRLSRRWRSDSKDHRQQIRAWLRKHYPEVWTGVA